MESRIAASTFGIVYNPATYGSTTGVASSQDQGVTWTATGSNGEIDDNLSVDQDTGRIFWIIFNGDPANRRTTRLLSPTTAASTGPPRPPGRAASTGRTRVWSPLGQ